MLTNSSEVKGYDFVLAGNIVVDRVKTIDVYPEKLQLAHVLSIDLAPGGLVCNCALSLARMEPSLRICAIGRVGTDEEGRFALKSLSKAPNIDLHYVIENGNTSVTDVMTVRETGERTFFSYHGEGMLLDLEDIPMQKLSGSFFHIGYAMLLDKLDEKDDDYGTRLAHLLHDAGVSGFTTSLDVVSDPRPDYSHSVLPCLPYTDILSVNEIEAEKITGIVLRNEGRILYKNLPRACDALHEMGVRQWAVIHMPELSCGKDREQGYGMCPGFELPSGYIQGSVGAGDVFTSALLLSAYKGLPLQDALRIGNAEAACALSMSGVADGVVSIAEALRLYDRFPLQRVL